MKVGSDFPLKIFFAILTCVSITAPLKADGLKDVKMIIVPERPKPPYRVWYQPGTFRKHPEWYKNATMFACGSIDPLYAYSKGKTVLDWTYGINYPKESTTYWQNACSIESRLKKYENGIGFLQAGIALDEWTNARFKDAEIRACNSLRKGRELYPDVFILVWTPSVTERLAQLVKEGVVDLVILENYTFVPSRFGKGPYTISWQGAIKRCERAEKLGILDKTISCIGHITDEAGLVGNHITKEEITKMVKETKSRFPKMPGIAFYQGHGRDTKEAEELIKLCDQLSKEYWPD